MMAIFSLGTTPPPLASLLTALVVERPLIPAHTLTPSHSRSFPAETEVGASRGVYADSLVDRGRTAMAEDNPRLTARRASKAAPDILCKINNEIIIKPNDLLQGWKCKGLTCAVHDY